MTVFVHSRDAMKCSTKVSAKISVKFYIANWEWRGCENVVADMMAVHTWAVVMFAVLVLASTKVSSTDHLPLAPGANPGISAKDMESEPSEKDKTEHESPAASSIDPAVSEDEGRDTAKPVTLLKRMHEFEGDIVLQIDAMMQELFIWCLSKTTSLSLG